jgi:hypothetical protein
VDWLLAAHQVAPLQFEMGGLWNPVSVRDQMVRGQEIARRAEIAKLIGASRPLIVVGAGAGGVAAALTADKAGIPVVVIERGARPFDRQLRTPTRTIYPYLYDWPHDGYIDDALVVPAVLPWLEARADLAAHSWIAALGGRRFIAYGSTVSLPPAGGSPVVVHGGMVDVHVSTPAGTGRLRGGMLLSSVGFGAEITSIPAASGTYHGWYYWEPDTLDQHQLGVANRGASPRGRGRRSRAYVQRPAVSRSARRRARSRDVRDPARCCASPIDIGGSGRDHPPRRRRASGLAPGKLTGQ